MSTPALVAAPPQVLSGRRAAWTRFPGNLAYLITAFFLSLIGFPLLLALLVFGLTTALLWIGLPVLGFTLLLASGFGREGRELVARMTGRRLSPPVYRDPGTGPRRLVRMVADPQLWRELIHAVFLALPLRLAHFVVAIAWVAAGAGGLTWFAWSVFLPEQAGLATLLLPLTATHLDVDLYLADSLLHGVLGVVMVLLAPFLLEVLVRIDSSVTAVFLAADEQSRGAADEQNRGAADERRSDG